MASYLDFGFDTFLRVKIQKVGVIDAVYVPAISSEITVDTSSVSAESVTSVFLNNDGLKVKDTDATHGLTIQPGSNLTADRTLTVTTGDSNRTLTLNGDVVLPGGTLTPSNGGIVYSTDTALAVLAGTATAGQHLQSGASSAPSWTTATYPATTTANQLLYSSATNTITGLATAASSVLVTNGSSVPSLSTDIPTAVTIGSAYIYRASGTDVPVTDGGTGVSTLTGLVKGNGASAFTAVTAPSGTVVGTTDAQTLTNKILTFPRINTINDYTNNVNVLTTEGSGSNVNYFLMTSVGSGSNPTFETLGSVDSNVTMLIKGKGTGCVRIDTNRQNDTTNSVNNSRIQYGWGYILGDGTYGVAETVTFPVAFTAAPVVIVSSAGSLTGSNPTAISDLTSPEGEINATTRSITTTNFSMKLNRSSEDGADPGVLGATVRYGYSWIAIG